MISQSEVPRHIATFEAALRNGMRRASDVIIIGECRDAETMSAAAERTGNGKSTLMAGMTRKMLEDPQQPSRDPRILRADRVHLRRHPRPDRDDQPERRCRVISRRFEAAFRNGMRRAGDVIIIGECRDADTMSAAADAALTSHAVYSSIHAGTLSETIQRIVSLCPVEKRKALTVAIAQTVAPRREPAAGAIDGRHSGRRSASSSSSTGAFVVACRKPILIAGPNLIDALLEHEGQSYRVAARRALEEGRITEETVRTELRDVFDVA